MKTFTISFFFILTLSNQLTGQVQDSMKFKSLLPKEFDLAYQKEEKAIIVDVREFFEYRKSRLKGAVNIPSSGNLEFASDTLNKEQAVFLYCTTGFRSKRVAKFLCTKGFDRVYSLEGGIVAWRKAKLVVDRSRVRKVASSLHSSIFPTAVSGFSLYTFPVYQTPD
jgi:rhodanese-related sulfurtransferase